MEDVADTLWDAAIFRLTTLENEKDVARNRMKCVGHYERSSRGTY